MNSYKNLRRRALLQSLSKPFLFYIAAQSLPWVCQLQQFLEQLFCSKNSESSIPDYSDVAISYRPDRIVGGDLAEISEAPYLLSMQIFGRHFCTATLVSYSWALTAAQCFPGYYAVKKMIVYGGTQSVPGFGLAHRIGEVQIHLNFKERGRFPEHNIAAIKIETSFDRYGVMIEPISLPSSNISNADDLGTIFGWGALKELESSDESSLLHKASIPVWQKKDCEKVLRPPVNVFCAGYFQGGAGPCHGDTGVPLVIKNEIYGIFSSSEGCGRPNSPSLYTAVWAYHDWIKLTANV